MLFYPVYSECDCVSRLGRTRLRPAEEPFVGYVVDRREPVGDTGCGDESWTRSKRLANTSAANSVPKVNRHEDSMFVMIVFVRMGSYRLASSHRPIAVIDAENSAARSRIVTLRIISFLMRFPDVSTLSFQFLDAPTNCGHEPPSIRPDTRMCAREGTHLSTSISRLLFSQIRVDSCLWLLAPPVR
jgi:hypothetical protein